MAQEEKKLTELEVRTANQINDTDLMYSDDVGAPKSFAIEWQEKASYVNGKVGLSVNGGMLQSAMGIKPGDVNLGLGTDTSRWDNIYAITANFSGQVTFGSPDVQIPNNLSFGGGTLFLDQTNKRIGVNTDSPLATAAFQVDSTTKAVYFPRMTTAQKNAITTPGISALVFDTTVSEYQWYDGSSWKGIGGGIRNVVEDTSPELGASLDAGGFDILNLAYLEFSSHNIEIGGGNNGGSILIGDSDFTDIPTFTENISIGHNSLFSTQAFESLVMGREAGHSWNVDGTDKVSESVLLGDEVGSGAVFIEQVTGVGYRAVTGSFTGPATINGGTFFGYQARANDVTNSVNEMVFGYNIAGKGSNTATWGNASITDHYFSGALRLNSTSDIASAAFQIDSTTKAFFPPRMTDAQRNAMTMTAADKGATIFNIDDNNLNMYDGTNWILPDGSTT